MLWEMNLLATYFFPLLIWLVTLSWGIVGRVDGQGSCPQSRRELTLTGS